MENSPSPGTPLPPPRSRWRQFGYLTGLTVAVIAVLYFVASSSAFLQAVVLPRLSAALNAKLTVGDISLSPFRQVQLRQVKLTTTGAEPVFAADYVRVRYSLLSLIAGRIVAPEVTVVAPVITVVQSPDGTTNLDPLLQGQTNAGPSRPRTSNPLLRIENVSVSKGRLRHVKRAPDGASQFIEVAELEFTADRLQNGEGGKLKLAALVTQIANPTTAPGSSNQTNRLQTRVNGVFDYRLEAELTPSSVKGDLQIDVTQAQGAFKDLAGLKGRIACETTPLEVREVLLRFERSGQRLGQVRLAGPMEVAKREARLRLEITDLDRNVLNFFGAPLGLDFGGTHVSASALVDVSQRGQVIASNGKGNATQLSVRRDKLATPPLDLAVDFQLNLDLANQSAVVHRLSLTGKHKGAEVLTAVLDRSLYLSWGLEVHGLTESTIDLALSQLKLEDWQMLLGTNLPSGTLSASAKVMFKADGRRIPVELSAQAQDLTGQIGTNALTRVRDAQAQLHGRGTLSDFRSLLVEDFKLQVNEQGTPLFSATGSAGYDLKSQDATLQIGLETDLPNLLKRHPVPSLSAQAGRLTIGGQVSHEKGQDRLTANLGLSGFTGQVAPYGFNDYELRAETDVEATTRYYDIRRVTLSARQSGRNGGSIDLSGRYDHLDTNGQFVVKITDLNLQALQPLLTPLLAPRQLASLTINGTGAVAVASSTSATLKLDTDLARLQFTDPALNSPLPPQDLKLQVEAAQLRPRQYEVRRLALAFPHTAKATNLIQMEAKLDLAASNPTPSQCSISAASLDLGPLYDALRTRLAPSQSPVAPLPTATETGTEPNARPLPIQSLTAEVQIGTLYLHDLAASNVVATAKLHQGLLKLDPFSLILNGAPVTAAAAWDVGRPNGAYEASLKAEGLPLLPLTSSFTTNATARLRGNLHAALQLKGAGTTGASLQKNLTGEFDLGSTNLNLAVANVRNPLLKTVVNVILSIPDLVRRPDTVLGSLLDTLKSSGGKTSGGWVNELTQAPIDTIQLRAVAGAGRIDVQRGFVQSAAFQAEARGPITLAPVLTNSTLQLPVAVFLRQPLAAKAGLAPASASNTNAYARLPDFLAVKGTVGDPKTEINKTALAALTLKAGANLLDLLKPKSP